MLAFAQNMHTSSEPKKILDGKRVPSLMVVATKNSMLDLVAYVDGGSQGNPGPSGIGIVIAGHNDGPIRIAKWIGQTR